MDLFEDEWSNFPKDHKWKECVSIIKEKCGENKRVYYRLKKNISILMLEGNATEDDVLIIEILKEALENNIINIEYIINNYDDFITKGVELATQNKDESFEEYSKRIFENTEYKFIRKILTSNMICKIENPELYDNESITKDEANILLNYKEKTDRRLINRLKNDIDNL